MRARLSVAYVDDKLQAAQDDQHLPGRRCVVRERLQALSGSGRVGSVRFGSGRGGAERGGAGRGGGGKAVSGSGRVRALVLALIVCAELAPALLGFGQEVRNRQRPRPMPLCARVSRCNSGNYARTLLVEGGARRVEGVLQGRALLCLARGNDHGNGALEPSRPQPQRAAAAGTDLEEDGVLAGSDGVGAAGVEHLLVGAQQVASSCDARLPLQPQPREAGRAQRMRRLWVKRRRLRVKRRRRGEERRRRGEERRRWACKGAARRRGHGIERVDKDEGCTASGGARARESEGR